MAQTDELAKIIESCKKNSPQGFSKLLDLYAGRLYGYFYRLTGNRAVSDDLLSELFVRLVEKIDTYSGGSFESWLFTTASNIFRDYLRDKHRREKLLKQHSAMLESEPGPDRNPDDERMDRLQQQLQKLDEDTRQLILLRFYSQASFKQLAQMRAEPIGTTLSKVHRGLKRLRKLMEQNQK